MESQPLAQVAKVFGLRSARHWFERAEQCLPFFKKAHSSFKNKFSDYPYTSQSFS
jgi:hypothetical protein